MNYLHNNKLIINFALSNKKGGVLQEMTKREKQLVLQLAISIEFLLERVESNYITENIQELIKELKAIANK